MLNRILDLFPAHIHPLTLVSDPDRLLAGESVMLKLAQRGFQVIHENDPVLLRHRVEEVRPFTSQHPLLVITTDALEDLPFDLYQPAYRLTLSLHQYFPNLAYPVLQTLSPAQLERLASCPQPSEPLGRQKTIDYLLQQVFDADPSTLMQQHQFISWLTHYHQNQSPLPQLLRQALVERLKHLPAYHSWDIDSLLASPQSFAKFIQSEWSYYIHSSVVKALGEEKEAYHLAFSNDDGLQDLVPDLVRKRVLAPLEVSTLDTLPEWAKAGVSREDNRSQLIKSLLDELSQRIKEEPSEGSSWATWKVIAGEWSELNSLWFDREISVTKEQKQTYDKLCESLDKLFVTWLKTHYAPLGAQRLPVPKHVHHVPHYLAYLRSLGKVGRLALIVLDGLSLADWFIIQVAWGKRHPEWKFQVDQLMAQIPTITSLSRYALISGLRPADFASDLDHIPSEASKWNMFWSNEGIPSAAIECKVISLERDGVPQEVENPRLEILCLIDDTLDRLTHNATLGTVDQQSCLRLWLEPNREPNSTRLEELIDNLLERQFTVFITSDHGHVEAVGFGQPSEGLLAQTRGKRARLYTDRLAAQRICTTFPESILWENDGLNPLNLYALMPAKRNAFSTKGEIVVTHGGVSLDEVVIPFVQISK